MQPLGSSGLPAERFDEACRKLETLLLRYIDMATGQLEAIRKGAFERAARLAVTAEKSLIECRRTERQIQAASALLPDGEQAFRRRMAELRTLGWTADAVARQLGAELSTRREQLLRELAQLEAGGGEPFNQRAALRPNLVNIKT